MKRSTLFLFVVTIVTYFSGIIILRAYFDHCDDVSCWINASSFKPCPRTRIAANFRNSTIKKPDLRPKMYETGDDGNEKSSGEGNSQISSAEPEIVIVVPSAPRPGTSFEVLLEALSSLSTELKCKHENETSDGNITNCFSRHQFRILVFNTAASLDKHPTFKTALNTFNDHKSFRFIQLTQNSPLLLSNSSGAAAMPDLSSPALALPTMPSGGLVTAPRAYESPRGFLRFANTDANRRQALTDPVRMKQTADFLSALHAAHAAHPLADLLLWEDDSRACPGSLAFYATFRSVAKARFPHYALLKGGHGGSGILIRASHVDPLIAFVYAQIYLTNVDIGIYKYGTFFRAPHFHASETQALHRGVHSSLNNAMWKELHECGPLIRQWGSYGPCPDPELAALGVLCADQFNF